MTSAPEPILHLYRQILKAAKYFPSKKRDSIIREIKLEFKANKGLADSGKLAQARQVAERGLSDLRGYMPVNSSHNDNIDIHLKGFTQ
ncbi:hypothetical protein V8C86DRAFT_2546279 [Haematococcus lacustris]